MEQIVHSGAGASLKALFNPLHAARNIWSQRELTVQMASREIAGRYRSSMLGMFWAVITPLLMLAIYTFAFSKILKAKWNPTSEAEATGDFAITLFCGMIVFNLFAEAINRSPSLIVSNPNLVKKVIFPLEVLSPATLLAGFFSLGVGIGVWLLGWVFVTHSLPSISLLWLPVVLAPLCLFTLGASWVLAALGVFARDIGHMVALVTQVLFFTTPVFFRLDTIKAEPFRTLIGLNPLTHVIEDARRVMMGDYYLKMIGASGLPAQPEWTAWLINLVGSGFFALFGYALFMKSKRAFSDVL